MELAPTTSLLSEQVAQLKEKSLATLTVAASCCPSTRYLRTKPVCGPHVGPPPPDVGPRGGGGVGVPDLEMAWPQGCPRMMPRLREGASDSTSWTPCSRGCSASPSYTSPPKRVPRGCSLKPCVAGGFVGLFGFFCIWKRERCLILPYVCFYLGTNVGCVHVCFLVGVHIFLINGKKKYTSTLPFPCSLPHLPSFQDPNSHFVSVWFCYESTSLFVILGSPDFLFSVKFPYA